MPFVFALCISPLFSQAISLSPYYSYCDLTRLSLSPSDIFLLFHSYFNSILPARYSMNIGRFQISAISGSAESTIALANANFDFTLVKVEAPAEYKTVGNLLSVGRRSNAEDGNLHATARRIGAMFESQLPETPLLIKSYGLRASEIVDKLNTSGIIAPGKLQNLGIFSKYGGIDATSLWAGATSGPWAIQAHLLACLLARMWTGPEAISIWVDLIESRRRQVQKEFDDGQIVDPNIAMALMQNVSRKDLADWDASARSWLSTADQIEIVPQKQLQIIVGNLGGIVNSKPDVYRSVLDAWVAGLKGLEKLLQGLPTMAETGDMIPALLSWHLYPDLMVLNSDGTLVRQGDKLFPAGCILTFGASFENHERIDYPRGPRWSLPLAYLRYYGDPIRRETFASAEGKRLTVSEFKMAILGCILGGWRLATDQVDVAVRWIVRLATLMQPPNEASVYHTEQFKTSWLHVMGETSKRYLAAESLERRRFAQLLRLGQKHAIFVGIPFNPFFGLGHATIMAKVSDGIEETIEIFRTVAHRARLEPADAIIRYISSETGEEEYATAIPQMKSFSQRLGKSNEQYDGRHVRWVRSQLLGRNHVQHEDSGSEVHYKPSYWAANAKYKSKGEDIKTIESGGFFFGNRSNTQRLSTPALVARRGKEIDDANEGPTYKLWHGDPKSAAIFVRIHLSRRSLREVVPLDMLADFYEHKVNTTALANTFATVLADQEEWYCVSLKAVSSICSIYDRLKEATIDVRVLGRRDPLSNWYRSRLTRLPSRGECRQRPGDLVCSQLYPWFNFDF